MYFIFLDVEIYKIINITIINLMLKLLFTRRGRALCHVEVSNYMHQCIQHLPTYFPYIVQN